MASGLQARLTVGPAGGGAHHRVVAQISPSVVTVSSVLFPPQQLLGVGPSARRGRGLVRVKLAVWAQCEDRPLGPQSRLLPCAVRYHAAHVSPGLAHLSLCYFHSQFPWGPVSPNPGRLHRLGPQQAPRNGG